MVSCPAHRTSNLHSFKAVISQRRRLPAHTSRTADDHLSVREGVKVTTSTGCATRSVASTDYKRWSPYGAPWLQTLAINRKSDQAKNARNKRNSSPWVAPDGKEGVDGSSPSEGFSKLLLISSFRCRARRRERAAASTERPRSGVRGAGAT